MSRRLLTAGLSAAALLGALTTHVAAKPPDLPLVDKDVLTPLVPVPAPSNLFPPAAAPVETATQASFLFAVRPSSRRMMASCLLFGVHPLLTLAPTDDYLDADDDDYPNQRVVQLLHQSEDLRQLADEWESFWHIHDPASTGTEDEANGTPLNEDGLTATDPKPAPALGCGGMLKACWRTVPHQIDESAAAAPEPLHVAPKEVGPDCDESACPWMRRHAAAACPAISLDEFDSSHDVLHNLETLELGHSLLEYARDLGRDGHVMEALNLLDMAHDLCPANRLDEAVRQAAVEVFTPIYCGAPADDYGTEDRSTSPQSHGLSRQEREIERKLGEPVSVHCEDAPLIQVIDDLRAAQNISIYVDTAALEAQEVSLDHPVSLKIDGVSLKSTLKVLLKQVHLTYIVRDEVLEITTEQGARDQLTRAAYRIENTPAPVVRSVRRDDVTALMRECHAAMEAGQIRKATALAREAFACDPDQASADPLVYKMHLAGDDTPPPLPITPCLPPVDPGTPAALDQLYHESLRPVSGVEEPEAPAEGSGVESVGAGTASSYQEAWDAFLENMRNIGGGSFEVGFSADGFRLFGQFHRGGAIWHVHYADGGLSVWASPDAATDAAPHD